jgi:hypothetical protein
MHISILLLGKYDIFVSTIVITLARDTNCCSTSRHVVVVFVVVVVINIIIIIIKLAWSWTP